MPVTSTPATAYRHATFLLSLGGVGGIAQQVSPKSDRLTWEPGPDEAFYFREKLSGPLEFTGADFRLLYALDTSADRCLPIYLTVELRGYEGGPVGFTWRGTFTCNEVDYDLDQCKATVSPLPADGYQQLFEDWDREVNILDMPAFGNDLLKTIKAQLVDLPTGLNFEFKRVDVDQEVDYVGTDGWAKFLTNTSFISGSTREHNILIFRYRRNGVPMEQNDQGEYEPLDLSASGWQFFTRNDSVVPPTADYVKTPEIRGFKAYEIGTFTDWWHTEGGNRGKYGTDLVLLPCDKMPSDYGLVNAGYIRVTGPDGEGANNSPESDTCLNVRRNVGTNNFKSLWWKFGQFSFTRCFPLLEGLYYVLQQTAPQLLPSTPAALSDFYSAATNPVTGAAGTANELPGLLLAAGSDIKRFGSSEPATRLLISLKQLTADLCTMHDLGYYIDPATGWFRLEHRSFFEQQVNGQTLDLRPGSPTFTSLKANVPGKYTYLSDKLPRYERLQMSVAVTEEFGRGISFQSGEIEYSGACVNSREGQNTAVRNVQRLTGDLAGLVLSGDALPDSALAVLAPAPSTALRDGNRPLAASELLLRYHRFGRVRPFGIVRGTGMQGGTAVDFSSVRLSREQAGISLQLCSAELLTPPTKVYTQLSTGARITKAELILSTGIATLTVRHPAPEGTEPGPLETGLQFNNSFNASAG